MNPTQYLLCVLISLCLYCAMMVAAQSQTFNSSSGKDLTNVTYLDFTSTEVEMDALGDVVGQSEVELSTVAGDSQEESSSSQPSLPGNSGIQEDPEASSESTTATSLLPPVPFSEAVAGELDELNPFSSTLEPWFSLVTMTSPSGFAEMLGLPPASPTNTRLMRPGSTMEQPSSRAAEGSALGGQKEPTATRPGTPEAPAVTLGFTDTVLKPSSSSVLQQLLPGVVGITGSARTLTMARGSISPAGPPIGSGTGVGTATPDPDHRTATEVESKAEEPGQHPEEVQEPGVPIGRGGSQKMTQVVCRDWNKLAGKSYVILNMTENSECEVFRSHNGLELLKIVAESFSRKLSTPTSSWLLSLSKPSEHDKHLLMMLASDRGTIPAKEVITMLGDVKDHLREIGIQNISSAMGCQGRPNQPRGDYGKLFIVLVIIGSICAVIIVSGFVYICWQRRLPKLTHMSHGEELHFVENGCHDNPTLDITIDSTVEMQEKKPSVNGDAIERSGGWNALVNKRSKDEGDSFEEDTHL
ncbi:podocalyxin-like protein 2 [Hypanus sabinus]|uniref:podocalyxin-like protein 2 n=1 Tax=Hypanus sabinus TaxID=79690 RepID=UPI0028C3A9FC|nr:podocalyxin-like protein 2 [Hypanus sabinus]